MKPCKRLRESTRPEEVAPAPPSQHEPLPIARSPGESHEAFLAFLAYFGQRSPRTLAGTAQATLLPIAVLRYWSAQFRWTQRVRLCQQRLLRQQLEADGATASPAVVDWTERRREAHQSQYQVGTQLMQASQQALLNLLTGSPARLRLREVARIAEVATKLTRRATDPEQVKDLFEDPKESAFRAEMEAAIRKVYGVVDGGDEAFPAPLPVQSTAAPAPPQPPPPEVPQTPAPTPDERRDVIQVPLQNVASWSTAFPRSGRSG